MYVTEFQRVFLELHERIARILHENFQSEVTNRLKVSRENRGNSGERKKKEKGRKEERKKERASKKAKKSYSHSLQMS